MSDSIHSAAGQALGYLHQCMSSLVAFGRRVKDDDAITLRLEVLDDVQFDRNGTAIELLQVKHHISHATLTTASVDLWRTLQAWMDLPANESAMLRLVTTAVLPASSDLQGIRAGGRRDELAALRALRKAARADPGNQTSKNWRNNFLGMDDDRQEELIARMVIEDGSSKAGDIDFGIVQTFRYAIPLGRESAFCDLVRGWWAKISVQLLDRSLSAISGSDLIAQVCEIGDQLRSDNLPIDPAFYDPVHKDIRDNYESRPFVQQLLWIALDDQRLWMAIRDYHKSYTQRSYWLRHQLVSEVELDRYAFRLHDEWEQVFTTRLARMRREASCAAEVVGQEIYEAISSESRARVRERFDEAWFSRGTLHALADGEFGYLLGWHPEFEEKLEEILTDVEG
jgi:hypothetical protein